MKVVKTDRFDARAYDNALDLSPDLQSLKQRGLGVTDGWTSFQNDIFQQHYQYAPELIERDKLNGPFHQLINGIKDTEEYQIIHELTKNDVFNASIASHTIGQDLMPVLGERLSEELSRREALARRKKLAQSATTVLRRQLERKQRDEQQQAKQQNQNQDGAGEPGEGGCTLGSAGAENDTGTQIQTELDELSNELLEIDQEIDAFGDDDDDESSLEKEIAEVRRAYRQAAERATETLTYLLGAGSGLGLNTGGMSVANKRKLAARLTQNKKLQEIFQEAGRIKKIVGNKTANVIPDRREERVGIKTGRMPIHDILIHELAMAGDPRSAMLFAKKYVTETLMLRRWTGKEQLGAGPIIILRDDSGSMRGSKEVWAKAITLAFMNLAQRDKRDVYVMAFSHVAYQAKTWEFLYRSKPGDVTWDTVLDCMEMFIGGGTDFMYPLDWGMERIENALRPGSHPADKPWEKADIILISDGEADVTPEWKTKYMTKQKELQFHTFAVLLGSDAPSLKDLIGNMHPIKNIAKDPRYEFKMSREDEENAIANMFTHSAGGH